MKHFSTRDAARILEVTEDQIRTYARLGEIVQVRGPSGRLEFQFEHLLLLKTTKGLLEAGVPARRLRRIWSSLRRQLAADMPLTSIAIYADGDRAIAWDGKARWQPDSGQFLLNFDAGEVAELAGAPPAISREERAGAAGAETSRPGRSAAEGATRADSPEAPSLTAEQWFHLGCELEARSPVEARQAYRHALELDPDLADAHLNLGRLEHEAGELGKAEAHYRDAVRCAPNDPTSHFNLGVLLEDRGRPEEAAHAYEQAIARDASAADAHYNLGLLLETLGRRSEAMRHLMNARRLYAFSDAGTSD
jgi:tetratricopeptide (TPR) repeat protein